MKGALDVILRHCTTLPGGSPLTLADKDSFVARSEELGNKGLRGEDRTLENCRTCLIGH